MISLFSIDRIRTQAHVHLALRPLSPRSTTGSSLRGRLTLIHGSSFPDIHIHLSCLDEQVPLGHVLVPVQIPTLLIPIPYGVLLGTHSFKEEEGAFFMLTCLVKMTLSWIKVESQVG